MHLAQVITLEAYRKRLKIGLIDIVNGGGDYG
jgi:hypothetical protein